MSPPPLTSATSTTRLLEQREMTKNYGSFQGSKPDQYKGLKYAAMDRVLLFTALPLRAVAT